MKLKNILLTSLSFVLVAALAVGGTLAYLTDTDSAVNVMTVGNVKIEQIEQERDENGNLVEFTQAKPALPAVYDTEDWADNGVEVNGTEYKVFSDNMKNVVDKIVTVNNTGKSDAYVRTIVAIEAPDYDPEDLIHINYNGTDVKISDTVKVEIDGVKYVVFAFTYNEALAAGEKSAPSLMQLFLDKDVDNDFCAKFGDTFDILVLSQAVQSAGFDSAQTALDTAFGDVTADKIAEWFGGVIIPVIASEAEVVDSVFAEGGEVLLDSNIGGEGYTPAVSAGATVVVDMKGNTVDADFFNNSGDLTLENGTLESGSASDYGLIARADSNTVLNNVDVNSAGGGIAATDGAYLEVNGGSVDVSTTSTSGRYNVYAVGEGTKVVINDGNFSFSKTLNQKRAYIYAGEGATVIVNGGTFGPASTRSGYTAGILGDGDVIIKGGTFGFNPSNWVADGYEAIQSGNTWSVSAK